VRVYEQREWLGIAKRYPWNREPRTCQTMINFLPGENELALPRNRKLVSEPCLAYTAAPVWAERKFVYKCHKADGSLYEASYDYASVSEMILVVKPDMSRLPPSENIQLAVIQEGSSNPIRLCLRYDSSNNQWRIIARYIDVDNSDVTLDTLAGLLEDTWYAARLKFDSDSETTTLEIYESGSHVPDTAVGLLPIAQTGTITIGPDLAVSTPCFTGSIAGFHFGGFNQDDMWNPRDWADEGGPIFLPLRPDRAVPDWYDPDFWWELYPVPEIHWVVNKGYCSVEGAGLVVESVPESTFRTRTVFVFRVSGADDPDGSGTVVSTVDNTFHVWLNRSLNRLTVSWPAYSGGDDGSGLRQVYWEISNPDHYFAVVLDPVTQGATSNVSCYEYDASSETWNSLTASSGTWTRGIRPPDDPRLVLISGAAHAIEDFELYVGEEDWVDYAPVPITGTAPDTLAFWLWPASYGLNRLRSRYVSVPSTADGIPWVTALSCRATGTVKVSQDPNACLPAGTICPYLNSQPLVRVFDAIADGDELGVLCEGFYVTPSGKVPIHPSPFRGRQKLLRFGRRMYVVGAGPLQVLGDMGRVVSPGYPEVYLLLDGADKDAATIDHAGGLDWDSEYKVKLTIVDYETGTEAGPYGPFVVNTGEAPATPPSTTSSATPDGCALALRAVIYSAYDLRSCKLRIWRYWEGDGCYHLDSEAPISPTWPEAYTHAWGVVAHIRLSLSDTELVAQPTLDETIEPIPFHTYATIWAGRAWYVPADARSRVVYSLPYQLGTTRAGNLIWTDEGASGDILSLMPGFGGLLLLMERAIWIVPYPSQNVDLVAQPLIPDVGVASPDAAVFAEGVLYWIDNTGGVCSFDGNRLQRLSEHLDNQEKEWLSPVLHTLSAFYDPTYRRVYWLSGSRGLVLDLSERRIDILGQEVQPKAIALISDPAHCFVELRVGGQVKRLWGIHGAVFEETDGHGSCALQSDGSAVGIEGTSITPTETVTNSFTIPRAGGSTTVSRLVGVRLDLDHGYWTGFPFDAGQPIGWPFIACDSSTGQVLQFWSWRDKESYAEAKIVTPSSSISGEFQPCLLPAEMQTNDTFAKRSTVTSVVESVQIDTAEGGSQTAVTFSVSWRLPGLNESTVSESISLAPASSARLPLRVRANHLTYSIQIGNRTQTDVPRIRAISFWFSPIRPARRR